MTLILAFLSTGLGKIVAGVFAAIVAAGAAYLRGRSSGKQSERNRRAAREAEAIGIYADVQNDVGAMSSDHIREELARRAKQ